MKCGSVIRLALISDVHTAQFSEISWRVELTLLLSRSGRDVSCDHMRALVRERAILVPK